MGHLTSLQIGSSSALAQPTRLNATASQPDVDSAPAMTWERQARQAKFGQVDPLSKKLVFMKDLTDAWGKLTEV